MKNVSRMLCQLHCIIKKFLNIQKEPVICSLLLINILETKSTSLLNEKTGKNLKDVEYVENKNIFLNVKSERQK